jgi:hypothetical protein
MKRDFPEAIYEKEDVYFIVCDTPNPINIKMYVRPLLIASVQSKISPCVVCADI